MHRDYWYKQEAEKPLYPQLEWSRPENRLTAGKLLIVGGHEHSFAVPAAAYQEAVQGGSGTVRVLLPEALRRTVGRDFAVGEYAAATPSGSFSQEALGELLAMAAWADGILFAGDLGRNAETAILLEKFLRKNAIATTLTKDAIDYISSTPATALERQQTLLVLSLSQLQRLSVTARFDKPVTFGMDLLQLVDWLHSFTTRYAPYVIVQHLGTVLVATHGRVSTTKVANNKSLWQIHTAAHASVWWMQNPSKPFEALTTSILQ